jgi:hypothetical protein
LLFFVFVFATEPLRSYSLHNILTKGWVCLLWICFAFVKCMYRTCSMLLKCLASALYTSVLSDQAFESRSCLFYVSYATTVASALERISILSRNIQIEVKKRSYWASCTAYVLFSS